MKYKKVSICICIGTLLIIFNLFVSSNILYAEIVEDEVSQLKKWGMSYCISSFSHIEGLASEASEAAEYYFIRGKFDDFLYYIRKYYNERVR